MKNIKLLLCLSLLLISIVSQAKIWRVNNSEGSMANFEKVVDAHNAAESGDTIYVEGSSLAYSEHLIITKRLVILGPGYFLGENPGAPVYNTAALISTIRFNEGSDRSVLLGVNVNNLTLGTSVSNIIIQRNHIRDLTLQSTGTNHLIVQNYIHGRFYSSNSSGFIFENNMALGRFEININSSGIVSNNVISNTSATQNSVHNSNLKNNIIHSGEWSAYVNNSASNNIANASQFPAGNNNQLNVDMANVFVQEGSPDGLWMLKEESPAIAAGVGGVDCGAFGGSSPYILSGLPPLPLITSFEAVDSASQQKGLEVKIIVKIEE